MMMPLPYPNDTMAIGTVKRRDMVDLETIIQNWSKQIFDVTKTRDEAKINKKHLEVGFFCLSFFNTIFFLLFMKKIISYCNNEI